MEYYHLVFILIGVVLYRVVCAIEMIWGKVLRIDAFPEGVVLQFNGQVLNVSRFSEGTRTALRRYARSASLTSTLSWPFNTILYLETEGHEYRLDGSIYTLFNR